MIYVAIWLAIMSVPVYGNENTQINTKILTVKEIVDDQFGEASNKMIAIFNCESNLQQVKSDGNIVVSKTNDYGISQINEKSWNTKATELNLKYKTNITDNIKMAKYVFDHSGYGAWVTYKSNCYNKNL